MQHKIKSQSALYNNQTTINSALKGPDLKVIKVGGQDNIVHLFVSYCVYI
jgi:hypothetical protein